MTVAKGWCYLLLGPIFVMAASFACYAENASGLPKPTCCGHAGDPGDPTILAERYTLSNGLEVILAQDSSVPLVAVNLWYHVGSGCEVLGKSGFAHLFEHMMFQGSKNVGADKHFEILKKIGGEQVNATTNFDRTSYFEVVPSNQLETALWLESDRMSHLLDILDARQLANQIDVVRNERRQRYENQPYGKALFAEYEALYPGGHPYRHLTIGLSEDLERASLKGVKKFFRTWYVPSNATLAIVGDFNAKETKKLVEKWFGSFPKSHKPTVVPVPAPTISRSEITVSDDLAKLRQIKFAWHTPAFFADGDAELDIVADALAREGPGRLYKALVYDKPLAQNVQALQDSNMFSSVFEITVTLRGDADLDEVKRIVLSEVARLTKENLSEHEISRVVAAREAGAIRQLETVLNRSQTLQTYNHYLGNPDKISWDLDRYRKASAEMIRDTVAAYLSPEHMVTVITLPAHPEGKF
jgi:zinc protease